MFKVNPRYRTKSGGEMSSPECPHGYNLQSVKDFGCDECLNEQRDALSEPDVSLNERIQIASWRTWQDWCLSLYGDQDFTSWERYRVWLLHELRGSDDNR